MCTSEFSIIKNLNKLHQVPAIEGINYMVNEACEVGKKRSMLWIDSFSCEIIAATS